MPGLGLSSSPSTTGAVRRAKSTDLQLLPLPPTRGAWENPPKNVSSIANSNIHTNSNSSGVSEKPKLDPSDPRVKKLVYSMYRDMLTTYNGEANDMINKQDPTKVTQDSGVGPILESIVMRQRSSQGGSGESPVSGVSEGKTDISGGSSNGNHSAMPPPPPPPPMMPGAIPSLRLRSEIGPRDTGPPAALASAMMKDKKPFTYTPGGIDLSEIRSPRMAKRIQMNAAAEGVTNTPTPSANQERPQCNLPPAALAAMQPQMAFPVFPQGNNNIVQSQKSQKPQTSMAPPPPPPPQSSLQPTGPPPPPKSPTPAISPPPPPERAATPKSPVPRVDSGMGSPRPNSQLNNQEERKSPLGRKSPGEVDQSLGVGTGSLFIPPIQSAPQPPPQPPLMQQSSSSPLSTYVPPSARSPGQTKAQAVSQSIGSLYIPPIGGDKGSSPQQMDSTGASADVNFGAARTPQSAQQPQTAPFTPAAQQLNKAPVPWMNSYNRMQNQQTDSPPYVHPGFFMPPFMPGARTIPIMRESDQTDAGFSPPHHPSDSRRSSSSGGSTPTGSRTPSQAATHLGRVIPIQIEREEAAKAKGAKIIPIQIEGRPPRAQTPSIPTTPMMNPMRRAVGPAPYNSPMGLYSNQNVMDAYQRQAAEAAAGVDKMNIRCESPRMEPIQSKAMRVIQQAAENELKRLEQDQQQHRRLDLSEDDRHLMNLLKSQVNEGSSLHDTSEPRFMGSHIPSKAFRALQTALPAGPGAQDHQSKSFPVAQPGGHVTHHIPIRQVAQSPTPQQSQASEIQLGSHQPNVPPSEQKVQEPKKYMGSNIPSRSFKILQQMTSEDGQPVGSAETTEEQNIADSFTDDETSCPCPENPEGSMNSSYSSFPLSPSFCSEGGGSSTYDPYNNNNNNDSCNGEGIISGDESYQNPWPDAMDQSWDPYTYMWYYWWYYSSCYWAGYDMSGYEYPPGWDPNYPYCPPEFFGGNSTLSEYSTAAEEQGDEQYNLGNENGVASSSSAELLESLRENNGEGAESYYGRDNNNDSEEASVSSPSFVPRIVIEGEDKFEGTEGKHSGQGRNRSVDSIKDNNSNSHPNNNRNDNNNEWSTSKISTTNPLTESNQKPGNLIPYVKNDCDSIVVSLTGKEESLAECERQKLNTNGYDKSVDEKRKAMEREEEEDVSPSSSDDEYESCCEDPDQKVIERETGPFNNNKPFVTSISQNAHEHFLGTMEQQQHQPNHQRKFEFHGNYNSELNAHDDDPNVWKGNNEKKEYKDEAENEGDEEDEKTDPGTDENNDDDDDYGGNLAIIEEPETPSSADDSDVAPLMTEQHQRAGKSSFYYNGVGGLSIEEYHSEESSESTVFDYGPKKNRLSTIDEITESRASSSLLSSCATPTNMMKTAPGPTKCWPNESDCYLDASQNQSNESGKNSTSNLIRNGESLLGLKKRDGQEGEDSEESSEDELSSVSVIENKSDATRGTESKREDETTSSSEEDSSSTDDDDEKEDDDDEDAEGADTAVTVRLPLKLCFTKTKSYRDITTVMVGDSEIEEVTSATSQVSQVSPSNNQLGIESIPGNGNDHNDHISSEKGISHNEDEEEEDEPVVSFTLSLSRQTSREDETKLKEGCNEKVDTATASCEETVDIDFWAEITKGEENETSKDLAGSDKSTAEEKSNQENKEDYEKKKEGAEVEPDVGFWGIISRDRSTSDFPRRRSGKQNEKKAGAREESSNLNLQEEDEQESHQWDPYESIEYKWEQDFNFWEKSSRTIETRRFSNFEITEDYESDSGLKPSYPGKKERLKKYTHHKRHSIPGPTWDRSSLPPRPTSKQLKDSSKSNTSSSNNEQEIKQENERSCGRKRSTTEEKSFTPTTSSVRQTTDSSQEDTSSWWSYWDEVTKENEEKKFENNDDAYVTAATTEKVEEAGVLCRNRNEIEYFSGAENEGSSEASRQEQKEECSTDISVEIKLSGVERYSTGESTGGEDDYQSFASIQQASRVAQRGNGGFSSSEKMEESNGSGKVEERRSLNHSCHSDATTVTTDNEDYSSSPEIKSSLLFPCAANHEAEKLIQRGSSSISDENSDESSSRSSGTTIGRNDKSEIKKQMLTTIHSSSSPLSSVMPAATSSPSDCNVDCEKHNLEAGSGSIEADDARKRTEEERPVVDTSIQIPVTIERNIEIQQESGERNKLNGKHQEEQHYHLHHHSHHLQNATSAINSTSSTTATTTTTCTCLMGDRIARAENLLWRIERFLHESLSLGSEDDSGVMTDLSRQISDVDTDVDNDLNETEFLLTAAAAAKERRGATSAGSNTAASTKECQQHIESCNFAETISSTDGASSQNQQEQISTSGNIATSTASHQAGKKPRPKSDIFLESTLLSQLENEEMSTEENQGVKMRSASERRALRYQRAKTHSRLFQLLQDECGRDEDLDEFDYDSDVGTLTCNKTTNNVVVDCQINVDTTAVASANIHQHNSNSQGSNVVMDDDCNNAATALSPTKMNDAQARRSRLLPLPIKNLLASSLSLDSNSSPSGSSGVLSPTSPVNRDQLLADIINEFHLRNQASTMRAQSQRRISSSFPSKVFKLLQHEFGEEFYQTFDCCGGGVCLPEDSLISPSMSTNFCGNDSGSSLASCSGGTPIVHECTIHKSESMKEFEEATNRILTNFMLRNATKPKPTSSESPCSTAINSQLLPENSKSNADFLEVPLRKKKGNLNRDPKSTKKS